MTKREQAHRDFVHTVDVLTASALAERELAPVSSQATFAKVVRNPALALAAAAAVVLAIALPVYLTLLRQDPGMRIASPPVTASAPVSSEPTDQRREIAMAEERARLQIDAELERREARRIAALEEARRREEERRKEEQRIVALEENRPSEARQREQERARLAVIPDDAARAELIRKVQLVLKRNRCYDGDLTGSSSDSQAGLDQFVAAVRGRGKSAPTRIELAKASVGDFETWLKDAEDMKEGMCPTRGAPPPTAYRPQPPSRGGGSATVQGVQ